MAHIVKKSSLEVSNEEMDQQIPGAMPVPGGDFAQDLGYYEVADSRRLTRLI